jgi:predicted acyl esterase
MRVRVKLGSGGVKGPWISSRRILFESRSRAFILRIELWPTAYRFETGHRIRLQVASGAHPRLARNTGSGEPLSTATRLVAADQQVFHGPLHPSAIVLTVLD